MARRTAALEKSAVQAPAVFAHSAWVPRSGRTAHRPPGLQNRRPRVRVLPPLPVLVSPEKTVWQTACHLPAMAMRSKLRTLRKDLAPGLIGRISIARPELSSP